MRTQCKLKQLFLVLSLLVSIGSFPLWAQGGGDFMVSGIVLDEEGMSVIGATVMATGSTVGTVTDFDGKFTFKVPEGTKSVEISYIGLQSQTVPVTRDKFIQVKLLEQQTELEEVVVVGYGTQKKNSVVGAIVQTSGDALKEAGVSTNLANALTGRLPGVTTISTSGMPGADDPEILIRAKSTWNNSDPLILVDGIERKMNDVDVDEVESISVLKDGSATAVYGVRGAEGVILITTKRGREGKPEFSFSTDIGFKMPSRFPEKMNSYDSYVYRNEGVEREVVAREQAWEYYMPYDVVDRYKNRLSPSDYYLYPDVDWIDEMLNDFAMTQRYNLNVRGGTKFAKYFGSLAYTQDDDIFNTGMDVGLPYKTDLSYKRYNYRVNLDLNLTKTTVFSVNVAGYLGVKKGCDKNAPSELWAGMYRLPSGVFPVQHEDGVWGYTTLDPTIRNPLATLNSGGLKTENRTSVSTDFALKQDLRFITPGLSFRASFSYDSRMYSTASIYESSLLTKYIDPVTGEETYSSNPTVAGGGYDFVLRPQTIKPESVSMGSTYRKMFYQFQLNYHRKFGKHDVGVMAVMNREQRTTGSNYSLRREDWVGRVTYNYADRYLFEANGAYNGSDQFGPDYRFDFFPSVAVGWMISNESFLKRDWLDKLKIRYSIGKTGNDNFRSSSEMASQPFPYVTQWSIDKNNTSGSTDYTLFGDRHSASPYLQYKETGVGNPNLHWETVLKQNLGLEFSVLNGMVSTNLDFFKDHRTDIFRKASNRLVMDYFGAEPVAANVGEVEAYGYEIELNFRNRTDFGLDYWVSGNYTFAKDRIIYDESAPLLPDYRKGEGFQIGQVKTEIGNGFMTSWDDVYASVPSKADNNYRLPGDLSIIDFNGDGLIDDYDSAPYGFTSRPQNTYGFSFGLGYKGFSFSVQFYGIFNTNIRYSYPTTTDKSYAPLVYEALGDYWTPDNQDAFWKAPRALTVSEDGHLSVYDGSYLRLKNAEIAYTFPKKMLKSLGVNSMRLYVGGNNLLFWSKLPEDREQSLNSWGDNLYPNLRKVNVGLNISF